MAPKERITAERLRELMHYDPETGQFTWRGHGRPGALAGTISVDGYCRIGFDKKQHYAHRLAWLYMTGEWPPEMSGSTRGRWEVDHQNGDRSDNRWVNLRVGTTSQNQGNAKLPSRNTSGLKGIWWRRNRGYWVATITVGDGTSRYLGSSPCKAAAHFLYLIAADEKYGEFARAA